MNIHWGRAIGGALLGEILQIVASVVWVAIYSFAINPGQPVAAYEAYAQVSAPWVSIIAGAPIFYAVSRWIAKTRPTALALFGIFLLVDGGMMVAMADNWTSTAILQVGLSCLTKLAACTLGGGKES
jgi:drug/metabolite transporter (DMT)-like permease